MQQRLAGLTVFPDAAALAEAAAIRMQEALAGRATRSAVCLSGGSTPARLYQFLATEPFLGTMPWDRVHWFWGDDRLVPREDERSNFGEAWRLLLNKAPIPPGNIHSISTNTTDPAQAAQQYETELRRFYGSETIDPARPLFDVVLMGVGHDGHTASLFPGQAQTEEMSRWVVGVPIAGAEPFVPRVSLTLPALASTRDMLFLVSGKDKRGVLTRIMDGADVPAARAYSHGSLVWLVDSDAAPENRHAA
jgi:6-phosphogluconolactonase